MSSYSDQRNAPPSQSTDQGHGKTAQGPLESRYDALEKGPDDNGRNTIKPPGDINVDIPPCGAANQTGVDGDCANGAKTQIQQMDEHRAAWVLRRRTELNSFQRLFHKVVPYGGILSSGFNLACSCIGVALVALPSAFQISGMGMALFYLVSIALLAVYSYTLIAIAGRKTGLRNYEAIVEVLMGSCAAYFLAFCMWFYSFGAEVSYVISLGDIWSALMNDSSSVPHFLTTDTGRRVLTSATWFLFMWPLTLPREINSLRYFSVVAVMSVTFFVLCMVIHSARNGLRHGVRDDLVYFQAGNKAVEGLGIFMFAYLNQLNAYEVFEEQYKPGVRRLTLSAGICMGLCFVLYLMAGLFGYLDFGSEATGSVLKLYHPIKEPLMGVCYVIMILKLCVGYGLHMIPVRDAVHYALKVDRMTIPWWKHAAIVTSMATLSLVAGLFIPRVNDVLGIIGGFSGGFIGFIFPALMYMYCGNWSLKTVGWFHYLTTYLLIIAGVIGAVFGTAATVYDII